MDGAAEGGAARERRPSTIAATKPRASERWVDAAEMLKELKLEQYIEQFEEEEMTSIALLEVRI